MTSSTRAPADRAPSAASSPAWLIEARRVLRSFGLWTRFDVRSTATLMVLAIIVGFGTGLAAVLFIKAIGLLTHFSFEQGLPQLLAPLGPFWIVIVPVLGALISGPMIAFWATEAKGHGVPEVLTAIIMNNGRIRPRVAVVKSVASTFCIGSGGSAGREGPIVQVGAALGSTAAQILRFSPERRITLVACGAAAGIAATFNAPIAGVIFAMEVILGEFTTQYFGAVVVSAVAASIVSRHFLGSNPAFTVPPHVLVSAAELPLYAILGVLAALVGWLFVTALYFVEDRFDGWHVPDAVKPAIGAVFVGLIALIYPQALGTGLVTIGQTLQSALPWTLLLALLLAKLLATCCTLGSGNSGGVFSPGLFMGAMLGGAFGNWVHTALPAITGEPGAYALVGMASVFAAAAHAPLTAFLIVFEMSGDYRMILPLMVTVGLSTLLSQRLRRYSIYTWKLAKRNIPLERDRDVDIMRGLRVEEVMTRQPDVVYADMSLQELSEALVRTHHHGFPVLDRDDHLLGVVTHGDLKAANGNGKTQDLRVADIAHREVVTVSPQDPVSRALLLMSGKDLGRVPVVDPEDPRQLVGLLRRDDIVRAYRRALLQKMQTQYRRENIALGRLTHTEVVQVEITSGMAAIGKRVQDLQLPAAVLIISVMRDGNVIIPHGSTRLQQGDTVVALAQAESVDEARAALGGKGQPQPKATVDPL